MSIAETEAPNDATAAVLTVSDLAHTKVLEIRSAETDPDKLGLRVAITGHQGVDFLYDLSLELIEEALEDDDITDQNGLTVMVPADSVENLRGATLDLPSTPGQSGLVIRNPNRPNPLAGVDLELEGDIAAKVTTLLEKSINPSLESHGGFATLIGVDEVTNNVYLQMGGGCQGCSMSAMTLTQGIQQSIRENIPEVAEVIDVTDHAAGASPFYS